MMGDETVFPSLKDLAFEVFYKELLSKATHPSIVDFVRNCIHYQLMGTMRNTIRKKCIKKWNNGHPSELIGSCTILDCVLDSSFTTLKIKIPASGLYQSFSKLISIIARRSPEIYRLVVNVVNATAATSPTPPEDNLLEPIAAISNESRLRFLRRLILNNCSDSELHPDLRLLDATNRSVLSLVGKCCPKLSQLTVFDFTITKKDIAGLILGELVDFVLPMGDEKWSEDSILECLRVRPEFLTPLCFTLDELELKNSHCVVSAFAFALHHLSELTFGEPDSTIIKAIKILSEQQKVCSEIQQEFDQVCLEATSHINCKSISIAPPSLSPDQDHLSLSILSYNGFQNDGFEDLDNLRAIRSMCPLLKSLHFNRISFRRMAHSKSVLRDLESTLSGWMLPSITLYGFNASSAPIVRSILNALAPSLKVLSFHNCQKIEMTPLAACNGLLELVFICLSPLRLEPNELLSCWTSNNFLPSLNTIKSENCLGCASSLFEGKSTLVSLTLNCCHIGTDGNNLAWSQIPELWPKLERLNIGQSTGLSMAMIPELVSRMGSLLRIGLPESVMLENPQLTRKVIQGLVNRELHPVKLYSSSLSSADEPCPFQRI